MSMPYYVPPEQMMREKADFARKGIARGKAVVALQYEGGIVIVAENPSHSLKKVSEIYDRIAFAGVGKYSEFDQLRTAGIGYADVTGFRYSRGDVEGGSLANEYAQLMSQNFTHESKPLEVEILVAEIGETSAEDRLFHITYDGTVIDESVSAALGGDAEAIASRLADASPAMSLGDAVRLARSALAGPERSLVAHDLEVAVLRRGAERRCFARIENSELDALLGS